MAKGADMRCPIDGTTLVIADRSGTEIGYCPKCRGAWLDRGELDKIIERAAPPAAEPRVRPAEGGRRNKTKRGGYPDEISDF